ncbi:hypothetical protein CAPTEDRAFT_208915 [Capitella teleta]|uniref:Uncharacterized protein n=1 Tax=Capitella teleta TaxID=283909 RepID=R7T669_CAPTE|nr:hypothetical protein CAPTEDRAFT_208915 [Capitella teleta]|eukprot:ELT88905.1 hypothetical protein CAPTEDRAFT_208915 [Capitella teleta]
MLTNKILHGTSTPKSRTNSSPSLSIAALRRRCSELIHKLHVSRGMLARAGESGIGPSAIQLNESAVPITWTLDLKIPEKYAQYFGYRIDYVVVSSGYGDVINRGPIFGNDAAKEDESLVLSDISAYKQCAFGVEPYREMEEGNMALALIPQTSNYPQVNARIPDCGGRAVTHAWVDTTQLFVLKIQWSIQESLQKDDRDAGQSSTTRIGQASTPALTGDVSNVNVPRVSKKPVHESSRQYEALHDGRPRIEQDPYTVTEGVHQDTNDAELM